MRVTKAHKIKRVIFISLSLVVIVVTLFIFTLPFYAGIQFAKSVAELGEEMIKQQKEWEEEGLNPVDSIFAQIEEAVTDSLLRRPSASNYNQDALVLSKIQSFLDCFQLNHQLKRAEILEAEWKEVKGGKAVGLIKVEPIFLNPNDSLGVMVKNTSRN
ncbi:MAG: hypothetical protein AAFO07_12510 [Bacteroidota bacterium]